MSKIFSVAVRFLHSEDGPTATEYAVMLALIIMVALGAITGMRLTGEEFPIEAAISQITLDGSKFYTVILRDITERKLAEEQLRRTAAET